MQLVAYGAQDIYLTGNPQITFFKVVYRRHTNFSMEAIEQTINGSSGVSGSGSVTISRNGDLVSRIYVTCEDLTAGDDGAKLIDNIELEIGGQRIDKQTSDWNQIWSELTTPESKAAGFKCMVGACGNSTTNVVGLVQVPLNFWFCRNPGLALPLIALQYHEVKLKCVWGVARGARKVVADYIYLDTDERRRFAQVSHEYLIEQIQEQSADGTGSFKLNFNHPVKELIWTSSASTGYTDAILKLNGHDRFSKQQEEYFQLRQPYDYHTSVPGQNVVLTDRPQMLATPIALTSETEVNAAVVGSGAAVNAGEISVTAAGVLTFRTAFDHTAHGGFKLGDVISLSYPSSTGENTTHLVTVSTVTTPYVDGTTIVSLTVSQTGANLAVSAAGDGSGYLVARAQDPLSKTGSFTSKINVYSFALKPEEHQPSGTCNFSRIDNAQLKITGASGMGSSDKIYAVNYNVLRIMSGMGGLAYSN